ncbi:MAG: SnoaL-like domain-containing protein [Pseudomonadota bacterium]
MRQHRRGWRRSGDAAHRGLAAIRAKHAWWNAAHQVHASTVTGPYLGPRADEFVVRFNIDVTPEGGVREPMEEIGTFTVAEGKIVQEVFSYLSA